jgi:predicted  nucleic acid-binding Zn-ribbon protein
MDAEIYNIAVLARIDLELDDLKEEFGDLPERVEKFQKKYDELSAIAEETKGILDDVRKFTSSSKITLADLKDKETKLSEQQFLVRNNKEFDAISSEITGIKDEYTKLVDELRTVGLKEENLTMMLKEQEEKAETAKKELEDQKAEMNEISSDQNEEVQGLIDVRNEYKSKIDKENLETYELIRTYHKDAAVYVRKNSCAGCFSSVPAQKIVEIRNNLDEIYRCEACGRVLIPEEIIVDEDILY